MTIETLKALLTSDPVPCDLRADGVSLRETAVLTPWEACGEENGCTVSRRTASFAGGLALCLVLRRYGDDGYELRLTLSNTGTEPGAVITDIRSLVLTVPDSPNPNHTGYHRKRVLYAQGSHAISEDFMPRECPLTINHLTLDMTETRSSSGIMPYFNYMQDEENGLFAAVGWSGHWRADFSRNGLIELSYPNAAFRLEPGESVDLPSSLLVPWSAASEDDHNPESFNIFRRFMKTHIVPKIGGKPYDGAVCLRAWGSIDEEGHNVRWRNMKNYALPSDAYGVDAGWYDCDGVTGSKSWYNTAGDWEPDPSVFPEASDGNPGGLAWLADGGRAAGSKGFWLWIEFERAVKQTVSVREHPEYYYLSPYGDTDNQIRMDDDEARHYLLNKLLKLFRETKMSIFRVDYNFDPGRLFAHYDEKTGNHGLTELKYYNGLYRFFDELKAELPDLVVDNCASGGRRLDYRMYGYAVPLMCRSDFFTIADFDPVGAQAQTMALARWLPVQADSCGSCMGSTPILFDTYRVRSSMACGIGIAAPSWELSEAEGAWYHDILTEAMTVKPYMSLDFYPLTGYSLSRADWAAWQTVSADGERAMVMAFRRELSNTREQTFALHGLLPYCKYDVTDSKGNLLGIYFGSALLGGYTVTLPEKRTSCIHFIRRHNGKREL